MDPDGRSLMFSLILTALSLGFARALGRSLAADEQEPGPDAQLLGLSALSAAAGNASLLALGGAVFCLSGWLRRFPLAGLAAAAAAAVLYPLFFSLGAASRPEGGKTSRAGALFAAVLGRPFLLPARMIFRAAGLSARSRATEEDVLSLVEDVEEDALIDENQREMISGVFELDDIEAGEIMTHRTEVEAVEDDQLVCEVIPQAREKGFSRLPVYHRNLDEIVGILHVKDLLGLIEDPAGGQLPIRQFVRPAMFVPKSCRARELLVEFRAKRTQIAVVVDEYGGTAGIVTMEDILEEIVGNIEDEFDREEQQIRPAEGGCIADGAADLEEVFAWFDLEPPERDEDEDFDSVSGLITNRLGRIPRQGEEIEISCGGLSFRVLQVGERRVEKVFCRLVQQPRQDASEPAQAATR